MIFDDHSEATTSLTRGEAGAYIAMDLSEIERSKSALDALFKK